MKETTFQRLMATTTCIVLVLTLAFFYFQMSASDKNDDRKGSEAMTLKIFKDCEDKALVALKSKSVWDQSGMAMQEFTIDQTKPIFYGLRAGKSLRKAYYKVPVVAPTGTDLYIKIEQGHYRVIPKEKVDATFFISRQELMSYESQALSA